MDGAALYPTQGRQHLNQDSVLSPTHQNRLPGYVKLFLAALRFRSSTVSTLQWLHIEILYFIFCLLLTPLFVSNCDFPFSFVRKQKGLIFPLALSQCWETTLISSAAEGSHFYKFPTSKCCSEEDYKVTELMCQGNGLQADKKTYLLPSTGRKVSKGQGI